MLKRFCTEQTVVPAFVQSEEDKRIIRNNVGGQVSTSSWPVMSRSPDEWNVSSYAGATT